MMDFAASAIMRPSRNVVLERRTEQAVCLELQQDVYRLVAHPRAALKLAIKDVQERADAC